MILTNRSLPNSIHSLLGLKATRLKVSKTIPQSFAAIIELHDEEVATGAGRSKIEAEQDAASAALAIWVELAALAETAAD